MDYSTHIFATLLPLVFDKSDCRQNPGDRIRVRVWSSKSATLLACSRTTSLGSVTTFVASR